MTREKDFEKAAMDYCEDHSHCIYFEAGAEYGYQYAVDKVCDILNHYCNRTGVHPSRRVDMIDHIRKAM